MLQAGITVNIQWFILIKFAFVGTQTHFEKRECVGSRCFICLAHRFTTRIAHTHTVRSAAMQ